MSKNWTPPLPPTAKTEPSGDQTGHVTPVPGAGMAWVTKRFGEGWSHRRPSRRPRLASFEGKYIAIGGKLGVPRCPRNSLTRPSWTSW